VLCLKGDRRSVGCHYFSSLFSLLFSLLSSCDFFCIRRPMKEREREREREREVNSAHLLFCLSACLSVCLSVCLSLSTHTHTRTLPSRGGSMLQAARTTTPRLLLLRPRCCQSLARAAAPLLALSSLFTRFPVAASASASSLASDCTQRYSMASNAIAAHRALPRALYTPTQARNLSSSSLSL
jgi:hypothetical protein